MKAVISAGKTGYTKITVPGSKSCAHRGLVCAALADGTSVIRDLPGNDDLQATQECLRRLGAEIRTEGQNTLIHGGFPAGTGIVLDCGESATTLRFLIPLAALGSEPVTFTGRGRLLDRPLSVYEEIFREQGLRFERSGNQLLVQGQLRPGIYTAAGDVSSQFVSGLMFALPLLAGDSVIDLQGDIVSRPYIRMTMKYLREAGITLHTEEHRILIPGKQHYQPGEYAIESDDSQAAFFTALGVLHGTVYLPEMNHDSQQADHAVIDILRRMNAQVTAEEQGYLFQESSLCAAEIDLKDCPDLGPILFVCAALASGTTIFRNTERLRTKESDRIISMAEELKKCGYTVVVRENEVQITGHDHLLTNLKLSGHQDHRVVMALSILAAVKGENIEIEGIEAVNKSYPSFFEDLRSTGTEISILGNKPSNELETG
ncbi:MAG: 3-phosphoshikimate 1-carboxyvinyltransferase [Solobacterium sp.]|nr:3-phosphoshikimate 1-carboxyvinyltransferase [Solobacterium sp.]